MGEEAEEETRGGTQNRYLPLDHLYSATSPCRITASDSSNVMSKKVKARKLPQQNDDDAVVLVTDHHPKTTPSTTKPKLPVLYVYSRRRKRGQNEHRSVKTKSFYESLMDRVKLEPEELEGTRFTKKRKIGSSELEKLGVDLSALSNDKLYGSRLRECRNSMKSKCGGSLKNFPKLVSESRSVKRWTG